MSLDQFETSRARHLDKTPVYLYGAFTLLMSFLFLFASSVHASGRSYYGVIQDIDGMAFVTSEGRTQEARPGMRIFDMAEIMTTVGSQVTFMDRYDHLFHLSSSGHVQVHNQVVGLKRGYLWVQSMRKTQERFALETANAQVIYTGGEGIFSFDDVSGRSQFLSVRGNFKFLNTLQDHFIETVRQGEFSFIDTNFQDGRPRRSTPVGSDSYMRITGLFESVRPLGGHLEFPEMQPDRDIATRRLPSATDRSVASRPSVDSSRSIASQLRKHSSEQLSKSGQTSSSETHRSVASVEQKAVPTKAKSQTFQPSYNQKSGVIVRVFGQSGQRQPASIEKEDKKEKEVEVERPKKRAPSSRRNPASVPVDSFESGLQREYQSQRRHSSERTSLINELKTFEKDFRESY